MPGQHESSWPQGRDNPGGVWSPKVATRVCVTAPLKAHHYCITTHFHIYTKGRHKGFSPTLAHNINRHSAHHAIHHTSTPTISNQCLQFSSHSACGHMHHQQCCRRHQSERGPSSSSTAPHLVSSGVTESVVENRPADCHCAGRKSNCKVATPTEPSGLQQCHSRSHLDAKICHGGGIT